MSPESWSDDHLRLGVCRTIPGAKPRAGPHGLYPSRKQLQHFSEGKSNPGSTDGRGRSADAARTEHGISKSRAAGSMACYLRVISRVQVLETVTSRAKQPGGERCQATSRGVPLSRKVGPVRVMHPRARPRLPLTPHSIHRHHLSQDHRNTEHPQPALASSRDRSADTTPRDYPDEVGACQ
jgi:hypothetical protein